MVAAGLWEQGAQLHLPPPQQMPLTTLESPPQPPTPFLRGRAPPHSELRSCPHTTCTPTFLHTALPMRSVYPFSPHPPLKLPSPLFSPIRIQPLGWPRREGREISVTLLSTPSPPQEPWLSIHTYLCLGLPLGRRPRQAAENRARAREPTARPVSLGPGWGSAG